MVWVTCSFLMEENEDRLTAFLEANKNFTLTPVLATMEPSGVLTDADKTVLSECVTPHGAIRLTPDKLRADGFFIAAMQLARN